VINFSDLTTDPKTGRIPESIIELSKPYQSEQGYMYETKVFIEGYMYPTKQMTEIRSFMLVPSIEQGQFGSLTRNPSQMIEVTLSGDYRVKYRSSPVKVGGTLAVNPDLLPGATPYSLKADVFR
jgi:hypothetical protein